MRSNLTEAEYVKTMMHWKRSIPWAMVLLRAVLAPLVVVVAWRMKAPEIWLGMMIATACVSDIYDGVLARRWGTATPRLRISDTIADTAFYLSVLAAITLRHWPVLRERMGILIVLLGLEAVRLAVDWMKFGKMASYHTYSAKVWGLLLAAATIALLCFDGAFWLVTVAIVWGIVCDVEGLAMSIVLTEWTPDVKHLGVALERRKELLANPQ